MGTDTRKKGGRKLNSSTEQIRQALAALGTGTTAQLRDVGFSSYEVSTALDTLLRQKFARRISRGVYEFIPDRKPGREAPLEDRIWHAMRINPKWSCSDIAIQAGTTVSYVYKRLRVYRAELFVRQTGVRQANGGSEKLWMLTGKGRERIERPAVEPFEPDPLVLLATKINKLVATGMARRFPDENKAARAACIELSNRLEEIACW